MRSSIADRLLDALDDAPFGSLRGASDYDGPLATVQWLAAATGCSDSHARSAALDLLDRGLVRIYDALDPSIGHRRLYVVGVA